MGERRVRQDALFYEFSLEDHVPGEHLLRSIDRFVELDGLRQELAPYYSEKGRPSIDPELLIRMLIVGYCFGYPTFAGAFGTGSRAPIPVVERRRPRGSKPTLRSRSLHCGNIDRS